MESQRSRQFMDLFVRHQSHVYSYILTLVPNYADADDLFQQCSMTLWEKWAEFDHEQDFAAWACGIARNHVRNFVRKRMRRGEHLYLGVEVIERLADVRDQQSDLIEARRKALDNCLERLEPQQRRLLSLFYSGDASARDLASESKMSLRSLYRRVHRLREVLLNCISSSLEGRSST
ncbi:MAG: sigma-70 family RNA polymerase sigma factor [Firmicutes bacterium]|nr:sigma-70 family RNA polymerase sigma factor [Bacillota bacterium]